MIPINVPQIGEEEIQAVIKVLRNGPLTHGLGTGPMVTKFERAFARFMNAKYAIAVNTGTSALHLAIAAAGVEQGDEVILPSFTFVATAEVIAMIRARPIFVDIDLETYNINPEKIDKAITAKTKAIMPVDLYGLSANMQPIREIADKHGLAIIEDSAQAHGASYRGKPPGAFADAACWSFYASKNMTTGEGGMVTTDNDKLVEKIRSMRSHGEKEKYMSFMLGHNYRMSELQAAIGLQQLRKLPKFVAKRRWNAERLSIALKEADSLKLPNVPNGYKHSWYLYTARLRSADAKKRDQMIDRLKQKGIEAHAYYVNPIHLMPYYKRFGKSRLPQTEQAAKQVFSLPVHPLVTAQQIDFIGDTVLRLIK
ncbi:aminotransferase class I/II-fold pyridoxal phosphate-dependent enzyme [Candidatus Bathyarchaeota archaeon]|nr:aminotransferase class I/II-fold pyridoxal phosphate-dependent enzyme [Candidatus Bathyarchaeota archaeon]